MFKLDSIFSYVFKQTTEKNRSMSPAPSHSDFSPKNWWVDCFKVVLIVLRKLKLVAPLSYRYFSNNTGGVGDMLAPLIVNFEAKLSRLIILN